MPAFTSTTRSARRVPWDDVFGYLRETNYDGLLAVSVFGWEEEADAIQSGCASASSANSASPERPHA